MCVCEMHTQHPLGGGSLVPVPKAQDLCSPQPLRAPIGPLHGRLGKTEMQGAGKLARRVLKQQPPSLFSLPHISLSPCLSNQLWAGESQMRKGLRSGVGTL